MYSIYVRDSVGKPVACLGSCPAQCLSRVILPTATRHLPPPPFKQCCQPPFIFFSQAVTPPTLRFVEPRSWDCGETDSKLLHQLSGVSATRPPHSTRVTTFLKSRYILQKPPSPPKPPHPTRASTCSKNHHITKSQLIPQKQPSPPNVPQIEPTEANRRIFTHAMSLLTACFVRFLHYYFKKLF
jgi:hypothetical protein